MNVMIVLLILASMVGMVVGLKKQKEGLEWGRPLTIVCLVLGALLMIVQFRSVFSSDARDRLNREMAYRQALGTRIGQIVASEFEGNPRVVVIPDVRRDATVINGFTSAMRGTGTVEVLEPDVEAYFRERRQEENIPAEYADAWVEDMVEFGVPAELLNDLLRQVEGHTDVLVLFSELPFDFRELDIWDQTERPRIILASGQDVLDDEDIAGGLERGFFHGVVMHNRNPEGWRADTPVPRDAAKAFDHRYIWVTRENYRQHL